MTSTYCFSFSEANRAASGVQESPWDQNYSIKSFDKEASDKDINNSEDEVNGEESSETSLDFTPYLCFTKVKYYIFIYENDNQSSFVWCSLISKSANIPTFEK